MSYLLFFLFYLLFFLLHYYSHKITQKVNQNNFLMNLPVSPLHTGSTVWPLDSKVEIEDTLSDQQNYNELCFFSVSLLHDALYTEKHRYWTGLMLTLRCLLFFVLPTKHLVLLESCNHWLCLYSTTDIQFSSY